MRAQHVRVGIGEDTVTCRQGRENVSSLHQLFVRGCCTVVVAMAVQYRLLLFCSPKYSRIMATTAARPPQKLTASDPLSTPTPEALAVAAAAAAAACHMIVTAVSNSRSATCMWVAPSRLPAGWSRTPRQRRRGCRVAFARLPAMPSPRCTPAQACGSLVGGGRNRMRIEAA